MSGVKDIVEYVLNLGGDLGEKASAARSEVSGLSGVAQATVGVLGTLAGAVLAAGAAYGTLAEHVASVVDEMGDLSAATGLSTDTINGLRLAAAATGGDLAELVPADLAKKMAEAGDGTGKAADAFKRLGVEVADGAGHLRSADAVFADTLNALYAIDDPTTRAALAMQTLGGAGSALLGTFEDVSDLDRFVELGSQFGISAGPAAEAAARWQSSTAALSLAMEDAGFAIVNAFGPAATTALGNFALGLVYLTELARGLPGIVSGFASEWTEQAGRWYDAVTGAEGTLGDRLGTAAADNWSSLQGFVAGADDPATDRARAFFEGTGGVGSGVLLGPDGGGGAPPLGGPGPISFDKPVPIEFPGLDAFKVDMARIGAGLGGLLDEGIPALERSLADAAAAYQMQQDSDALAPQLEDLGAAVDDLKGSFTDELVTGLPDMLSSAMSGGLGGLLAALGPIGAGIQAVMSIPDVLDQALGFVSGLTDTFEAFPEAISSALTETLPAIFEELPDLISAVLEAVLMLPGILSEAIPEVIASVVASIPEILESVIGSLVEALPDLIWTALKMGLESFFLGGPFVLEIAKGLWEGLDKVFAGVPGEIADAILDALKSVLDQVAGPLKNKEGEWLGTNLRAAAGEKSILGLNLPSWSEGTSRVTTSGLAWVHAGNEVSRASMRGSERSPSGPIVINMHLADGRDAGRHVRETLGTYGLGETLDPYGT